MVTWSAEIAFWQRFLCRYLFDGKQDTDASKNPREQVWAFGGRIAYELREVFIRQDALTILLHWALVPGVLNPEQEADDFETITA
jgi:hypothetical protein